VSLADVLVVDGLPVPLHVSVVGLCAVASDRRELEPLLDACGRPGLDERPLEKEHFPAAFQQREYWLRDDDLVEPVDDAPVQDDSADVADANATSSARVPMGAWLAAIAAIVVAAAVARVVSGARAAADAAPR
jgi:hypothetical protein